MLLSGGFSEQNNQQVKANESVSESSSISMSEPKSFKCKSDKLQMSFSVNIENHTFLSQQKCFVMTIHDLGFDHTQFQHFVHCTEMSQIKNRVIWLHVDLPGQELQAADLNVRKYPTLEDIADELVCVIDYLKIPQIVCMGEGAGANISSLFAIKHPNRCLGVVLIEPIGSSASIFESIRFKVNNYFPKQRLNQRSVSLFDRYARRESSFLLNSFQNGESNSIGGEAGTDATSKSLLEGHNAKNIELFAESFMNRSCLIEKLKDLKVDALIAVGKNSTCYGETKRFYKSLQESHKFSPQKMVNTPFLEIDNVANLLHQCPDRLAVSFQYFLQGIGLLAAIPMKNVLAKKLSVSSASNGRSSSIDEPTTSNSDTSSSVDIPSSNHSLNNL